MQEKNNPKVIKAWAYFDWANSAYSLVITSTIFPVYYTVITTTKEHGDKVLFFGKWFVNTALSNYAMAVGYLMMVFLLPILSSVSDYHGNKKSFMKFFTYLGGLACIGLFFFKLETLELGVILFALAAVGWIGGALFYNSYLPEIATPDHQDKVSAQGFAWGYIGSVILQIICFIFVLMPDTFGITDPSFPARLSFLLVGVWWIGFAQIPFKRLPNGSTNYERVNKKLIHSGFQELHKVWLQVKEMRTLKFFLGAFFFYSMGVQTIMLVAANFGEKILHLGASKLIITILLIQLLAILGAYLMSFMAGKIGNFRVLMLVVIIWILVCIAAYFITSEYQFYALACVVGLVMGGIQSLSRSTYSKLLPENTPDTASFFSFYDVTEKLAIVIGLFTFGYIEEFTGNMRNSAVSLITFFSLGLVFLVLISLQKRKQLAK
ncbi:MAG: MFS transporter [Sphingobacteriaceae bacterium]